MAFEKQGNRIPAKIGRISIELIDHDGNPQNHAATYNIRVLDQNGDPLRFLVGDLVSHLTAGQTQGIVDFLATMRAKAETEVLP